MILKEGCSQLRRELQKQKVEHNKLNSVQGRQREEVMRGIGWCKEEKLT